MLFDQGTVQKVEKSAQRSLSQKERRQMGQFKLDLHQASKQSWWKIWLQMVLRSQSPSASSSKQTAQLSSCVLYLFSVFILYLGMKLSKWLMSFSSEDLPNLPNLPLLHLKIKTARVSKKMKRKMPPRMNRNLAKRSQKSKTSISNCSVMSIVPYFANFMPRMKFYERPLGCEPKTIRGVLSLVQPSLIYQSLPPGSELLLSITKQSPLSCQTSMDQLLRLAVVWQSVKIRTTYASTS